VKNVAYDDGDGDDDDVDRVGLRLWTAATNGSIINPQVIYEHGQPC
jgi:hypothetical protein